MDNIRVFSYGGGVDSFTVLLLQTQNKLPRAFDTFIYSDVGSDSEHPGTIEHIETVAKPLALRHGIPFVTVQKHYITGEPATVYGDIVKTGHVGIPVYLMSKNKTTGGTPARRACTRNFKVDVIHKWLRTTRVNTVTMGIGFNMGEQYRAERRGVTPEIKPGYTQTFEFPLIQLQLNRADCLKVITSSGYPVPVKSACYFCPFTSRTEWIERRRDEPELFARAVALEVRINEIRAGKGFDPAYLHPDCVPLDRAVGEQTSLFDLFTDADEKCQTGYCGL